MTVKQIQLGSIIVFSFLVSFALDFLSKDWAINKNLAHHNLLSDVGYLIPPGAQLLFAFFVVGMLINFASTYLYRSGACPFLKSWIFGIMLGGAVGNLYERVAYGYATDFIKLGFLPAFSLADIAFYGGLITLLTLFYKESKLNTKKK